MEDKINHPQHYEKHKFVLEPIDLIDCHPACIFNVVKYITRYQDKGSPLEDLKKARFYYDRSVDLWHSEFSLWVAGLMALCKSDVALLSGLGNNLKAGQPPFKAWLDLGERLKETIYEMEKEK